MHLTKNKQKRTLPNFYSMFIIYWIYSVFHHTRPSNLMIMEVHLSQRLAYILRVHRNISHMYMYARKSA